MRLPTLVALLLLFSSIETASAVALRYRSVQWWTDLAETVQVVQVRRVLRSTGGLDLRPHVAVCQILATLKGSEERNGTAHLKFYRGCDGLKQGDRLLVFLATSSETGEQLVANYVVLANQRGAELAKTVYGDDSRRLTTNDALLAAVKSRLDVPSDKLPLSKRGISVLLEDAPGGWEDGIRILVRTADRNLKAGFLRELAGPHAAARICAINGLISYPGKDTNRTLAKIAQGDESSTVRAVAFIALRLTRDHETRAPDGFNAELAQSLIEDGCFAVGYMPFGKWPKLLELDWYR